MLVPHSRPSIGREDVRAVAEVLISGKIAQGEKVEEFEDAIARFIGTKYAAACSTGTAALHLALLSLGRGKGNEVIMPSYVCSSPFFAALHAGARPKVVDIDLSDLNICASGISRKSCTKVKAIIAPHMFGCPAEISELLEIGVPLIEDCSQSIGAEYKGRRVGCFGDLSTFSFYATKMITTGEGGMVLTNNEELYERIIDLRDYDKKTLASARYNYKMTDFQAALGLSQFKKLEHFIKRRRRIASLYTERFSGPHVEVPSLQSYKKSVFYRFVIRSDQMRNIRKKAIRKGVICEHPIFKPLHRNLNGAKCPNSDNAHNRALSIPLYPSLNGEEIGFLISTLESVLNRLKA